MAASNELKKLVDQMPDPDKRQMYTEGIDKEKIETAVTKINEGGLDNVRGLISLLGKPGTEADVKPHYALRCLANHILQNRDEKARAAFGKTLAEALGGDYPVEVKAYLCQELQWAGGREAAQALGKLVNDKDLSEEACMALMAIKDGAEDEFLHALPRSRGRNRLNILQGLGATGGSKSRSVLSRALKDQETDHRIVAGWGLARLGDSRSSRDLLAAADKATGYERIKALNHCLVLAESLVDSDHKREAALIYGHLQDKCDDASEAHVRSAAQEGLKGLADVSV